MLQSCLRTRSRLLRVEESNESISTTKKLQRHAPTQHLIFLFVLAGINHILWYPHCIILKILVEAQLLYTVINLHHGL